MSEPGAQVADTADSDSALASGEADRPVPSSRRKRLRPSWRISAGVAVAAVLVTGTIGMSTNSPLAIGAITIDGASADLQPQVAAALGVAVGDSFASLRADEAVDRIVSIEGIDGAEFDWAWWNTLAVIVSEQTPAAAIAASTGGFVVVDAQGGEIRSVPERPAGLPLIEAPDAAARAAALFAASRIPPEMLGQIDAVIGEPAGSVNLRLASAATVHLGDPTDRLAAKLTIALQLASTGAASINVTVPERPAVQGIPAPPR